MTASTVPAEQLTIFHAGSLALPLERMARAFEAAHPGLAVRREGGGSNALARMISEQGKPADIMASADHAVIDRSLAPGFTDINIRFATNQMVLCHTGTSRFASEITPDNWFEVLGRDGVEWGHSDPDLDPCGYRALMALQLAGIFHRKPGLYRDLVSGRDRRNVRPKPVELIALLQSGRLDYAWEYLSVAVQHGLEFVALDPHVNLSDYSLDDFYSQAEVEVGGKKPGEAAIRTGASITYGVALLKDAPNRTAAVDFLAYMLDPGGGLKILKDLGQPPFIPARVSSREMHDALPDALKPLVEVRN